MPKTEQEKATEFLALRDKRDQMAAREQAVKNLQWSGKLSREEKAVLYHACRAYDLDPALREIVVLGGNLYVTVAAMVRVAERSGTYAGCSYVELEPLSEDERRYKCIVRKIVKDGIIGEFEGIGRASPRDRNPVAKTFTDEMAQTRARGRALHAAYPIALPILEEADAPRGSKLIEVTPELLAEAKDAVGQMAAEEDARQAEREPGSEG